jgi:hypothetical protein
MTRLVHLEALSRHTGRRPECPSSKRGTKAARVWGWSGNNAEVRTTRSGLSRLTSVIVDGHKLLLHCCLSWPARRTSIMSNWFSGHMRHRGYRAIYVFSAKCAVISGSVRGLMGLIPWPRRYRTGLIILCGDFVRAVENESVEAISHHWGVCRNVVQKWRHALHVPESNPGTQHLRHLVKSASDSQARRRAVIRAENPKAIFGRERTPHERSHPLLRPSTSKQVHNRMARTGRHINPDLRLWTGKEDKLLGTARREDCPTDQTKPGCCACAAQHFGHTGLECHLLASLRRSAVQTNRGNGFANGNAPSRMHEESGRTLSVFGAEASATNTQIQDKWVLCCATRDIMDTTPTET